MSKLSVQCSGISAFVGKQGVGSKRCHPPSSRDMMLSGLSLIVLNSRSSLLPAQCSGQSSVLTTRVQPLLTKDLTSRKASTVVSHNLIAGKGEFTGKERTYRGGYQGFKNCILYLKNVFGSAISLFFRNYKSVEWQCAVCLPTNKVLHCCSYLQSQRLPHHVD